jgi:hypothetical protein
VDTQPLADCFALHCSLVEHAHLLARRLGPVCADQSDRLRLGAGCVSIAAQRALATRDEREAIRSWSECELGDRQIRSATYHALALGRIDNFIYDRTFAAAIEATRARRDEMLRLRRRVRLLSVV